MKLPPMNALRAFEAASRHLSVSRAAEELCVSQGAVSQQLRNLEDHLGRELFIRTPNSFALSEEGEAFAVVVQQALGEIALAASEVTSEKTQHTLNISMPPNLAIKWLMPRLGDFYQTHPDISITLDQSLKLATFKNDGVDAGIRFGDAEFDGLHNSLLIEVELSAVASPDYIAKNGRLESLSIPGKHRLLESCNPDKKIRSQHTLWEDIVEGKLVNPSVDHLVFPDGYQTFNGALQGQGIALAENHLKEEEIESGEIEYICEQSIQTRQYYYFVSPLDARPNPGLDSFRNWLLEQTKKYRS